MLLEEAERTIAPTASYLLTAAPGKVCGGSWVIRAFGAADRPAGGTVRHCTDRT